MARAAVILTASICCGLAWTAAEPGKEAGPAKPRLKILNGQPRLIVVNGYSTSFQWPKVLQAKLDRLLGTKRKCPVQVVSATAAGTPIAKWMDVETGKPLRPWSKVRRALARKGERPAIVLCQQSLQWVYGRDRRAGIDGPEDTADIRKGAKAIGKYVDLLHASGADLVFVSMHIYKHPMEPQIGNERLALAAYAKAAPAHFVAGPDVWTPTKPIYPWGFARDRVHPGPGAIAVMAHLWFEALCKHDGIDVPPWSKQEMDKALAAAKAAAKAGGRE